MLGLIVSWCVALVSAALLLACGVVLRCVSRARAARRLAERMRCAAADAPGGIGISVLCFGATDAAQVAALLAEEYACYEVIVALDRLRQPALYAELVARYGMIAVTPPAGVRELRRSCRRNFRRLVLLDRAEESAAGGSEAALCAASCDYVLPLHGATVLRPGAIRRLAMAVGERPAGRTALVRTRVGPAVRLFARETAADDGFGRRAQRRIGRACRVTLWEPLAERAPGRSRSRHAAAAIAAALCAMAVALRFGCWPAALAASTAVCCFATLLYVRATAEADAWRPCGTVDPKRR